MASATENPPSATEIATATELHPVPDAWKPYLSAVLLTKQQIADRVRQVGLQISADFQVKPGHDPKKVPVFLGVLTGSFMFLADLCRAVDFPHEIRFIKASSYEGTESKGIVHVDGLDKISLTGRDVIIVEDIVDTGLTLQKLVSVVEEHAPASVSTATFLVKKTSRRLDGTPPAKYVAFEIDDHFVVGYGLDCDQEFRHLDFVGIFKS